MRVAVFRARADGERTARLLAGMGHEAVLAPVLEIVPTREAIPTGPYDGIVFTSAHGVEAIASDGALPQLRSIPCYCVGSRTATEARLLGFEDVRSAQTDADRLCSLLLSAGEPLATLLFITGRDRKPVVEERLRAAGRRVVAVEVYDAKAIPAWDRSVVDLFVAGQVDAALHYSRRSVEVALEAADRGSLTSQLLRVAHHCIAAETAEPLSTQGALRIIVAAKPDERSLLATLAGGHNGS